MYCIEIGLFNAHLSLFQMKLCGKGQCMCDLGEFDETGHIQKKYNLLSWYLIAAIIFYAIPAYQLVTTYQQVRCG